jgi:autotransporter-associated beta strand protein
MIRRFFIVLSLISAATAQTPAFPGAEGFGAYAIGGRGGDVYVVTNLNSTGAGSFYEGITTVPSAGRTVVFAVSGQIHLAGGIATRITANKLTIAGQTAPGDGILLKDGTLRISGDDIVIRHLRFRHGKNGSGGDCIDLDSGCQNAILDHISMSFSTDENISSFGSPPENLTMQWSLNSWGLESHSCGGLWDQNHATCHHSLWAHNHTRNPKARPNGLLEWTNNVTFDWDIGFIMGDSETPAAWKANVRGNYFICPPGNIRNTPLEKASLDRNGVPNFSVWQDSNLHDRDGDGLLNGTDRGWSIVSGSAYNASTNPTGNYYKLSAPVAGSALLNVDSPLLGYKKLVSNSGALRTDFKYTGALRDEVDTRMIQNLTTQTRNHITRESDLAGVSNGGFGTFNASTPPIDSDKDGMPDPYENALGWNSGVQDHNTTVSGTSFFPAGYPSSYTRLEEYMHFKSVPHMMLLKNTATGPDIDLTRYTAGFSNTPVFTLSNITGGTATQSGTSGKLVHFTANNTAGRGGFTFTVTDAAGSTWSQQFAICITNSGDPVDLKWRGTGANWDTSSTNWLNNGAASLFSSGDRVTFDATGAAAPNITVPASVTATAIDFNASTNYSISGAGGVSSTGTLTKRGSGTLTLNNTTANSFAAISLDEGLLSLGNFGAGGTGKLSLNGGSLFLTTATGNPLEFNLPTTVTVGSTQTMTGNWSGTQAVTVNGTSNHLWSLSGTWTNFTGSIKMGTGNVRIRLNGGSSNSMFGSPNVAVDLGGGTSQFMNRNGGTMEIGSLGATGSGTVLSGTQTGTVASIYQIGGLQTDATFAGSIVNGGGGTSITKVGSGTWTLSGASTYTGTTTVSQGALLVDGSLGASAVTVSTSALLGGDGTIGGSVTANSGAILSPGTIPFTGATMIITGGLTLNGNTIYCDMSNTPGGANDKIAVDGSLALTGAQNFQFLLLNGTLNAGTYDLITATGSSASGVTLAHNLPTDSRQTFSLARSAAGSNPSKVWLTVTGNPATLTWTGTTSGVWDTVTANNWTGASPNTFYNNDDVLLNDTAATRSVSLSGTLAPRGAEISTSLGYAFTGAGAIGGSASLTKNGSGTLTFSNTAANTFSGGLVLNAGTIALANDTLNANGLGTGTVTLNGGVISMYDNYGTYNSFNAAMVVPAGATARLNADSRVDIYGSLAGGGTLNYYTPWIRATLFADWSAFSGTINVLTDSSGGDLRMGSSYSYPGFPNALVALTDKVWAYYDGTLAEGAGTTIPLGAISGTPLSVLQGGATGGRALTYRIGGKNTDATFAGTISERNTGTATNYVKTGTGTWTLGGTGNWNGGTTIEQGSLKITGTVACAGATRIAGGSSLRIEGGGFSTESVSLDSGATLYGWGNLIADLNAEGSMDGRGFSTGTVGTLTIQGSAFFGASSLTRLRGGISSDLINVQGDLVLDGTLQVSLASGTGFGRYRLISCSGAISGSSDLTGIPVGTTAKLSTSVAGGVDLVIDDSDEDGLPVSWEMSNFGNLTQTAAGDKDGDGSSNLVEYRLNLNPSSGASAFRATCNGHLISWPSAPGVVFTVKRNLLLTSGGWQTIATVIGGAGTVSSYSDPSSFAKAFYRVEFAP